MLQSDYQKLVDAMKASSLEKLCDSYDFSFGLLLRLMIEDSGIPAHTLYEKLGVTKTYFYDILKSKSKPPLADKQRELLALLHPSGKVRARFFDLAAKERGEFPADLQQHIEKNNLYGQLRKQFKL